MQINKDIIIINDFYPDPFKIREQALSMAPFPIVNELPGQRTFGVAEEQSIEIKLRFEAKFDEEVVENIPSILYHITPTQNVNKILNIGLVPKSRSKASYHPDRVYLSKDLEDIENLGEMFYQKTGIKNWTILKIETDIIPGDYLKLYTDPNYKQGYYTLNNIPPQAIEKVKEINL